MHRLLVFMFALALGTSGLHSQTARLDRGGRAIGVGGAFTGLSNSSEAIFYNPAGLASVPFRQASFFYAAPYGISELNHFSFSYLDPEILSDYGSLGLAASRYGFDLYNETMASISYANNFFKRFFVGVTLSYNRITALNYGSAGAFGIDLGILTFITPELSLGFSAFNLNAPSYGIVEEPAAQTYTLGVAYRITNELRFLVDFEKDVKFPLLIKSGVEYFPIPFFAIRSGFNFTAANATPSQLTAGFGFRYSLFDIDYAALNHPDLGLSHQLSFSFRFGKADTPENTDEEINDFIEDIFLSPKQELQQGKKINLNLATLDDFMLLPTMTTQIAKRILQYREDYGGFKTISELKFIRGVNRERFKILEPYVTLTTESE
ncbi:MAG: helix-hairpin-helix domain-containing protein [Chloroherpetonaceae bacterium]|nr:helix-hairpin-helix domain-containing protein [Chloroherpetonaceae bacterium]